MDIPLRTLRQVRVLAEHRNFAKAAKSLNLSQPALSRSIQELERILGMKLFERGRGGVELTNFGEVFLSRSGHVTASVDDLVHELKLMKNLDSGELRLGAGSYPGEMFVDKAVARLVRDHPEVRLNIVKDNWASLLAQLRKRDLDFIVALAHTQIDDPELQITHLELHQGWFVVRAGHPLLDFPDPTLADVLEYPFAFISRFPPAIMEPMARALAERGRKASQKALPSITCESPQMMRTIAAGSDAVAVAALSTAQEDWRMGRLAVLPLRVPWLNVPFSIIRMTHRSLSPLGEALIKIIRETDSEAAAMEKELEAQIFGARSNGGTNGARDSKGRRLALSR